MNMNEVQELERKLKEAKTKAENARKEEFLKPFREELAGRCFFYRDESKRYNYAGFIRFSKKLVFVPDGEHMGDHVNLDVDIVYAQNAGNYRWVGDTVTARSEDRSYSSFCGAKDHIVREVDSALFKEIWEYPKALAQSLRAKWETMLDLKPVSIPEAQLKGELDIPHIILEPEERSIIQNCVFLVGGEHSRTYLITPASVAYAHQRIADEVARDNACMHLYEACDMAYVERKREAVRSLKAKLT